MSATEKRATAQDFTLFKNCVEMDYTVSTCM